MRPRRRRHQFLVFAAVLGLLLALVSPAAAEEIGTAAPGGRCEWRVTPGS